MPLADLLCRERAPGSVVAFSPGRRYDWAGFCGHVSILCGRLQGMPRGRWLLVCESSYDFAVGLFALWQTGNIAVLPPNSQPGSLEDIDDGLCGVVCDLPPRGGGKPWLSPVSVPGEAGRRWQPLVRSGVCLELCTSGSTGERKRVAKTLSQLEDELAAQERTFGASLGDCAVVATVSHQHIYGLLHRLLWPLCAQRPFSSQTLAFWEEVVVVLRGQPAGCVVSSPTHLDRAGRDTAPALAGCRAIFSAGGPLRRATAENIQRLTGCVPIEMFGSTETGGVGWRQQVSLGAGDEWRPFDGVEVSVVDAQAQPSRLRVRSPFALARPEDSYQLLGDLGEVLPDGRFRVCGRIDRIVKIAESRVSLDEMERRLALHPWVARAALVVLKGGKRIARESIGAVVVLRPGARDVLESKGRQALSREFRSCLRRHFAPATLPRFFRYLEELPYDAQGKITAQALRELFIPAFDPAVTRPEFLARSQDDTQIILRLRVPRNLGYLDGHFPGFSLVPGVVQAMWVWDAATELLRRTPSIKGMAGVKFKEFLLPGHEFTLRVQRCRDREGESLRYDIQDGDINFSSGRFLLSGPSETRG